jgi:hypothetical protein
MKAERHYEEWDLNECINFVNYYLDNYRNRDQTLLLEQLASDQKRTFAAMKLRVKEVVGILTNKERGIYNITPNMVKATELAMKERDLSVTKMLLAFED